jgi:PKD repeat protein
LVAIVPGGCSDSVTKPVTANAKPNSDFSFATSGRLVSFNASQPGNTSYNWSFGEGGTSSDPNSKYHYLSSFVTYKYKACLTVKNAAGCISQTCKEVALSSSINSLAKNSGINVFPNPNKGNFTVTIEDPKSDISILVFNLLGDVIKVIDANQFKSNYDVDLNVANGVYLVKITNGGLISTQKITINK